jgi:nucleoid DNA-binding protein
VSKITKKHVASAIRKQTRLTTIEAGVDLDDLLATIAEALTRTGLVTLEDYGTFTVKRRGLRILLDPRFGQRAKAVSPRIVQFTPSKAFNGRLLSASLPGDPTTHAPPPRKTKPTTR